MDLYNCHLKKISILLSEHLRKDFFFFFWKKIEKYHICSGDLMCKTSIQHYIPVGDDELQYF